MRKKNEPKPDEFNIDEWSVVSANRHKKHIDEDLISLKIQDNPKNTKNVYLYIAFRKKILVLLGVKEDNRIMLLLHNDDKSRFLITRSPNGYRVNCPSRKVDYYFIRASIDKKPEFILGDYYIKPIFHSKGAGSGSMIELRIDK